VRRGVSIQLRDCTGSITLYAAMASREQNERKFDKWQELADGGRLYWLDVSGHHGWQARYLKEVDAGDDTIRFWQEIYDETGKLMEIHQKFPVDQGHRKV
jgi:hypothetical protein